MCVRVVFEVETGLVFVVARVRLCATHCSRPPASKPSNAAASRSALRPVVTTAKPASTKRFTMASPRPLEPPVMSAPRPTPKPAAAAAAVDAAAADAAAMM